jgi:transposase
MDMFDSVSSVCPFDTSTHGITVTLMHNFVKIRKYASHKTGVQKGDAESFRRRVYLHLYFNPARKVEEDAAFDHDLIELKSMLEKGTPVEDLSESAQNKARKYLSFRKWGSKTTISFNEEVCRETKRRHGYFALTSNCEKEPFECLRKYRKRETIESFFESMKQHTDSTRTRVWDTDILRGRMFVQFVALCYYEYLSNEIHKMKETLGETTGDPAHDIKAILQLEKKLKAWLNNTPVYLVLQWFDVVDCVKISSTLRSKRWTTEITQRDSLFLNKLGLTTL